MIPRARRYRGGPRESAGGVRAALGARGLMLCRPRVLGLPRRRTSSIFCFATRAGITTNVKAGTAAPSAFAAEREDAVNDNDSVEISRDDMADIVPGRGAGATAAVTPITALVAD